MILGPSSSIDTEVRSAASRAFWPQLIYDVAACNYANHEGQLSAGIAGYGRPISAKRIRSKYAERSVSRRGAIDPIALLVIWLVVMLF
jgi:hypothetical protein